MSQDILIKLENLQNLVDDDNGERINKEYQGEFYQKNGLLYLSYEENSEGLEGVRNIMKIDPKRERVLLLRQDPAAMKQDFVSGKKRDGYFKTPYGEIKIAVKTKSLSVEIKENSGLIKINYLVFLADELNAEHYLKLDYKLLD